MLESPPMAAKRTRLEREASTLRIMVTMRCRKLHHPAGGLCPDCEELLGYALGRLAACPDGEGKAACRLCPRHCYRPGERARIREVMAWAGPRMLLSHPLLALSHLRGGLGRKA